MSYQVDLAAIAGILVPVVVQIAKMILGMKNPTEITPEEAAAITLFEALIAFLEVTK